MTRSVDVHVHVHVHADRVEQQRAGNAPVHGQQQQEKAREDASRGLPSVAATERTATSS